MTSDTGIQEQRVSDDAVVETMSALSIVADELMETIRNAHLALEDCVDGRGGSAALVRAGELLHQARGALQITETYGAALLTEEMELACKYLAGLRAETKAALEATGGRHFMLGPGCTIPEGTPEVNIRTAIESARG